MGHTSGTATSKAPTPRPNKADLLVGLLARPEGSTIDDLVLATGWQPHSIRGALAGALKRKGHRITSETPEGVRRYRIEAPE